MTAQSFLVGRCSPMRLRFRAHWPQPLDASRGKRYGQGSGRTDAGVHALAQVMTFVTESSVPAGNFLKAMNDILPASVRVLEVREAPADFHARHSARAKTYRYRIYREGICPPFLARYVWHYPYPLAEQAMLGAAESVIGEYDFTSFAAVDP